MTKMSCFSKAENPLVSVLVPIYNAELYLWDAVESILDQTYKNIEVLLFDDGSTDGSYDLANQLSSIDKRITVIDSDRVNRGVVHARNILLSKAKGDYLCWQDADDVSLPTRIEKQLYFLLKNPSYGAVGTGIYYATHELIITKKEVYSSDSRMQRDDPNLCCATVMVSKLAADTAGFFKEVFRYGGEDGDWILRIGDNYEIGNLSDILYIYRQNSSSLTNNHKNQSLTVRLGVFSRYAAQVRRSGFHDPIDRLDTLKMHDFIGDERFLDNKFLSLKQKLTAISIPYEKNSPLLSIILPNPSDVTLLETYFIDFFSQSFKSFELIILSDQPEVKHEVGKNRYSFNVQVVSEKGVDPIKDAMSRSVGKFILLFNDLPKSIPAWFLYNLIEDLLQQTQGQVTGSFEALGGVRREQLNKGKNVAVLLRRRGSISSDPSVEVLFLIPKQLPSWCVQILQIVRVIKNKGFKETFLALIRRCIALVQKGKAYTRNFNNWRSSAAVQTLPIKRFKSKSALIVVGVIESWGDFDDALLYLTPDGSGVVNGVQFLRAQDIESPDFILVLNSPPDKIDLDYKPGRLWFGIGEPPTLFHRGLHIGQGSETVIVTCDKKLRSNVQREYIHALPILRTWHVKKSYDELLNSGIPKKTKNLSWVTSNAAILDGHQKRLQFLSRLQEEVAFDLFGKGFRPIADKWDGLAPYKYSIAFENTIAPSYVTEKLFDCFVCGTMPLYCGDPEILQLFPEKALIRFYPDEPNVIERIKDIISSDLYSERMVYIEEAKHLILTKYNVFNRLADYFISRQYDHSEDFRRVTLEPRHPMFD